MNLNRSHLIIYILLGFIAAMLWKMISTWQDYEAKLAWLRYHNSTCRKVAEQQGDQIRGLLR